MKRILICMVNFLLLLSCTADTSEEVVREEQDQIPIESGPDTTAPGQTYDPPKPTSRTQYVVGVLYAHGSIKQHSLYDGRTSTSLGDSGPTPVEYNKIVPEVRTKIFTILQTADQSGQFIPAEETEEFMRHQDAFKDELTVQLDRKYFGSDRKWNLNRQEAKSFDSYASASRFSQSFIGIKAYSSKSAMLEGREEVIFRKALE